MFRKEYKQANDNIKVDEALLERTLEAAFAEKPKRKVHYYRAFVPVAATLVVVIGASVAYPGLVEKPEIEQTAIFTVSPTANPDVNMSFDAAPAPVSTTAPKKAALPKKSPAPIAETKAVTEDIVVANEKNDSVPVNVAVASEEAQLSVARAGGSEIEAYNNTADTAEEGFPQISCKFSDGTEEYVYENEDGKTFTVKVKALDSEELHSGITFERNGKLYILSSENMTESEIMEAFEILDI